MTKESIYLEKTYDLIALDMDGTLLNSKKEVDPLAIEEMKTAVEKGKLIALSTGRCLAELSPYSELLNYVHYGVLESGAMLYDFKNKQILNKTTLPSSYVEEIIHILWEKDIMYQPMVDGQIYFSQMELDRLDEFSMEQYRPLYEACAKTVPETREFVLQHTGELSKFNLYHTSQEAKLTTYKELSHLPVEIVEGEPTAYEVSAKGVSKGNGLLKLCEILGLEIEKTAAVGDSTNDESILKTCGLPIAMGNAKDFIKELSQCIVADNDHHGCAEAIRMVFGS